MQLTIPVEVAGHVLRAHPEDDKLVQALAGVFMRALPGDALTGYLFTPDVAAWLLAQRLKQKPEETLENLQRLLEGKAVKRRRRRRAQGTKATTAAKGTRGAGQRKRRRMTPAQARKAKDAVLSFLKDHPWSNRKAILAAVRLPSQPVYQRIMGKLREEGLVVSRGERSRTVYALKRAAPKKKTGKKAPSRKARQEKQPSAG